MKDGLRKAIIERGYWRINFRPTSYGKALGSLRECRQLIATSSVEKRGWDYPHITTHSDDHGGAELFADFVQDWTDWQNHREFWRMYQSGQFLHYLALREDWVERDQWPDAWQAGEYPRDKRIRVLDLNWQVTEVFELLSRIAKAGIYDSGAEVSLALHGADGRKLTVDPDKVPFSTARSTSAPVLDHARTYSREEIANPRECAVEVIAIFYDMFGWNPSPDQIRTMQEELYAFKAGRG